MLRVLVITTFGIVTTLALPACRRSETTAEGAASSNPAPAAPPAVASAAAAVAPAPAAAGCPAGKWLYDYGDQFLETLARNSPGARVVSERGSYTCTINGTERGSYTCETSEGGVENVIEAPTGPVPLKVTVKMAGRSSVDFEPAGPGRWRTTRADTGGLRVETKATIGGRDMPMPAFDAFPGMDRAGTILEYRCEGDTLKIKPVVDNVVTDFATLKRVP